MPNTILHFGPNSLIAVRLSKFIELPLFLLINVFINSESYAAILFRLQYPIHGYFHTFLFSSLIAIAATLILYPLRSLFFKLMRFLRLEYQMNFRKMLISSLLGAWLHIILDAPVYEEMQPFFPIKGNPWYLGINEGLANIFCALFFIPIFIFYIKTTRRPLT